MKYVLFVCTQNAGRSQMAQAFFERYAPKDVHAESAGQDPAKAVWPEVVEAMHEVDIDLSGRKPKRLDLEMQLHADWAITLACAGSCPYVPSVAEDWDVADPHGRSLEEVREIRDEIERRVIDLIKERLDSIRSDRTAHGIRLRRLLPSLVEEFSSTHSAEEIRACADMMLARYDEAPVRSFALALAERETRACLREGRCKPGADGSR
jgi:arsenate reductase